MTDELYKRYRPQNFQDVVGQKDAVRMLVEMGKKGSIPHTLLFTGESGCGKTTLARILRDKLKCGDKDFQELNAADDRGIDMVREIRQRSGLAPIQGPCRIWLIDEAHQMTPQAQESFLKLLEDTPKHVYFFLATTDPGKLKKTIITRCTEIKVRPLKPAECMALLKKISDAEQKQIEQDVAEKIVEMAEGSARKALVLLHQVIDLATEDDKLEALQKADAKRAGIDLARLLMNPRSTWKEVATVLKGLDEEPETIRRIILGYFQAVSLNKPNPVQEIEMMGNFLEPYFNTGKSGLVHDCGVAILSRKR